MTLDVKSLPSLSFDLPSAEGAARPLGEMVSGLVGSEILRIAAEVRALKAEGQVVCDLTVGDFSPAQFRVPKALEEAVIRAVAAGQTNYPPSDGVPELRRAIQRLYEDRLGLSYPLESIIVAGGARPVIYSFFRTLVDAGDTVVFPVPSWNNNHYAHLCGARSVAVEARSDNGFLPTAAELRPHLPGARLLSINSPLNPAGSGFRASALREIAESVVEENSRRERAGSRERPLFLLYDHIYWYLASDAAPHSTPVGLVPEVAPYTLFVDGISKGFAATGLRVGWGIAAPSVMARFKDLLGHVGAWAPRPEQVATAELLADPSRLDGLTRDLKKGLNDRLDALYAGLMELRAEGLPVDALPPSGALYLSARFDLVEKLGSNRAIRKLLLEKAGLAVVHFGAFGLTEDTGWFRLSIGAVSVEEIRAAIGRVRTALVDALASA
jgi:aspartate aminotransferase